MKFEWYVDRLEADNPGEVAVTVSSGDVVFTMIPHGEMTLVVPRERALDTRIGTPITITVEGL